MKFPIVKSFFFFSIGILFSINFQVTGYSVFVLLVLIIILLTVFEYFTKKSTTYKNIISELLIIFALLLAGFSIVKMKDSTLNKSHYLNYSNLFNQESKMIVKINSPVKIKKKSNY